MSRADKVHKLANAVKEYRGTFSEASGKWIRAPKPSVKWRIAKWLRELRMNVPECMTKVDAFKSHTEFNQWLNSIQ